MSNENRSHLSKPFLRKACLIMLAMNVYVVSNVLFGPNNIKAYQHTEQKIQLTKQELSMLYEKNAEYEKEIAMLQGPNPDQDYLEELVKSQLNYSYPDEKVIIYSQSNKVA